MVETLLGRGCKVGTRDGAWRPALHYAAMSSQEIVRVLLAVRANVYTKDQDGKTPLHLVGVDVEIGSGEDVESCY